jgi:pyrimidine operon attenuation protein/uracil phosphoribosyltransferase
MSRARGYEHAEDQMSNTTSHTPFQYDSRGNRLERWTTREAPGGHELWLRGSIDVVRQVQAVDPEYRRLPNSTVGSSGWTHALFSPEPEVKLLVRSLLDLLTEILSIPTSSSAIDLAVALDWHKVVIEGMDSNDWPRTEVGNLVWLGKYRYRERPKPQAAAGHALTGRICSVIDRHALLKAANIILDVPGHDSERVSFGPRLADAVARCKNLPFIRVQSRSPFRPQAKDLTGTGLAQVLDNEFAVPVDIRGRSVLIVDDVIRTGGSIAAVGKAARRAGASTVFGVAVTRTRRR